MCIVQEGFDKEKLLPAQIAIPHEHAAHVLSQGLLTGAHKRRGRLRVTNGAARMSARQKRTSSRTAIDVCFPLNSGHNRHRSRASALCKKQTLDWTGPVRSLVACREQLEKLRAARFALEKAEFVVE
jgi:hypothetical protein